jgi:hypothetical protein
VELVDKLIKVYLMILILVQVQTLQLLEK